MLRHSPCARGLWISSTTLFHDLVIELLGSTDVEGESLDFAAECGGVAVVFGTRDVVAVIEFVGHVAEEIAE